MRLTLILIPLLALAACAGPQAVAAGDAAPSGSAAIEPRPDAEGLFSRSLREEDIGMFFSFLRQTLDAAAEGRKPPEPPPELSRRADEIGRQMKREGADTARLLLDEMEREVRQMLREQR